MSLWPYSGTNSAGLPVKGKVVADDVEGAKSRLAKMSVKWEKVGDEVVCVVKSTNVMLEIPSTKETRE